MSDAEKWRIVADVLNSGQYSGAIAEAVTFAKQVVSQCIDAASGS